MPLDDFGKCIFHAYFILSFNLSCIHKDGGEIPCASRRSKSFHF